MFSRCILQRSFASVHTAVKSPATAEGAGIRQMIGVEKVSHMPDALTVASVDLQGPVTQLVMAYRAGSRYEQPEEAGLVHFLRNVIGTDSQRYTGLKLLWQSGSIGSNIQASLSKDLFIVQLTMSRTHDKVGVSILGELAQPAFKVWDVKSRDNTLEEDLYHQTPEELVIENLHKAAYRNGPLATPLLSPAHQLAKRTNKQLIAFARSRLITGSAVLVGINIDHSVLVAFANEQKPVPKGLDGLPKPAVLSPYHGGDVRVTGDTTLAHVAIAGHGARLSDIQSVAVQAVLAALIGKGPNTKMVSAQPRGIVSRHVVQAAHHNPVGLSAINIIHSDSGLIGAYLVARGDQIQPLVRAAIAGFEEIAKIGPSNEDLEKAKKTVALETLVRSESSSALAIDIAAQVLANGKTYSPNEFIQVVQKVSANDLKKAATQLTGKLSLSAYGQIHMVPYADVI